MNILDQFILMEKWLDEPSKKINAVDFVKEEIDKFRQFSDNWDGYGAPKINETVLNNAISIYDVIDETTVPDITPNPNGTISFEWISDKAISYLEIGETKYCFYIKPILGEIQTSDGKIVSFDKKIKILLKKYL